MPLVSDRQSKPLSHSNSRAVGFWMSVEGRAPIQAVRVLVSYEAYPFSIGPQAPNSVASSYFAQQSMYASGRPEPIAASAVRTWLRASEKLALFVIIAIPSIGNAAPGAKVEKREPDALKPGS